LAHETYEKEAMLQTADELRCTVNKLEDEKVDNGRAMQDMKQLIARAFCLYLLSYCILGSSNSGVSDK